MKSALLHEPEWKPFEFDTLIYYYVSNSFIGLHAKRVTAASVEL